MQDGRGIRNIRNTLLTLLLGGVLSANAAVTSFEDILFWTGSGANQAALVIDWNDGLTPQSMVWGYRWDGTATGLQMLQAVTSADSRFGGVALTDWGWGWSVDGLGYDLNGNGFDVADPEDHYNPGYVDPDFWGYYVYDADAHPWDGAILWVSSSAGVADRELADGSWDGWRYTEWGDSGPLAAVAAIPEPASGILLGLGVAAVSFIRRRRP